MAAADNLGVAVVALDVGGSSVKSGIVRGRDVLGRTVTSVASDGPAEVILATLAGIVAHHLAHLEDGSACAVALAFPGPFDYERGICRIRGLAKYESIYGLDIGVELRARLPGWRGPVAFRNDAEAAILGEAIHGAGAPFRRLIGVTLGTGFGSAFVADRRRVAAGPLVPPVEAMLYAELFQGERADDVFSTRGLRRRLDAAGATGTPIDRAADAARTGDAGLRDVFRGFGRDLGTFLVPYAVTFGADAVIVAGGIAGAFDLFGGELQMPLPVPALSAGRPQEASLLGAAILFEPITSA